MPATVSAGQKPLGVTATPASANVKSALQPTEKKGRRQRADENGPPYVSSNQTDTDVTRRKRFCRACVVDRKNRSPRAAGMGVYYK